MGYLTLILRNLLGRPARTALTVLGVGVGIAAVVMLTGISWGFERSMTAIYQSRGIDLIVVRGGISDQLSSNLDEGLLATIAKVPGVASAAPSLMDAVAFEEANLASVLANGWEPGGLLIRSLNVVDGRGLEPGDAASVILGRVLARNLGKGVGDEVAIAGEPFRVVGVYESDSLFENGGLVVPLAHVAEDDGTAGDGHGVRGRRRGGRRSEGCWARGSRPARPAWRRSRRATT